MTWVRRVSRLVIITVWLVSRVADGAEFSGMDIELLAQVPSPGTHDIWGWTDPLTGIEYALLGGDDIYFYDLSDPANPQYRGRWFADGFDVKAAGNLAFSNDGSIFDLTRLRGVTTPQNFSSDGSFSSINWHNIFINEETSRLYGASGSSLIALHDVSDPFDTVVHGAITGGGHDSMSVIYNGPDSQYQGREILFGSQNTRFGVYDVTDIDNPVTLADIGGFQIAHQGWPSEDHRYFFMTDENRQQRIFVFDIADLDNVTLIGEITAATVGANFRLPHNVFVVGDLLVNASYTGGVRIWRLDDPGNLQATEIGALRSDEGSVFGVYPFFESGTIIASDQWLGLLVMRPTESGGSADFNNDGDWTCEDLSALAAAMDQPYDPMFDLNGDGIVRQRDLDRWLQSAAEAKFGVGGEFSPADANLDGVVDELDLNVWISNRFTAGDGWTQCVGDFNGDNAVDLADLHLWNELRGHSSLSPVPEPASPMILLAALGGLIRIHRRGGGQMGPV